MPASSTTATVFASHPSREATCALVIFSVPTNARAIVEDWSATFSLVITSAALPVGARPTTVLPSRCQATRAAFSEVVLPAPAGATTTPARSEEQTAELQSRFQL